MERTLKELFLQAIRERNIDRIKSCINLGADVNIYNNDGFPVLFLSMRWGNSNMLELFLAQPNIDVNIRCQHGSFVSGTALMRACFSGRTDVVRRLCQAPGINLNCQNNPGRTAALFAVIHEKLGCVQILSTS